MQVEVALMANLSCAAVSFFFFYFIFALETFSFGFIFTDFLVLSGAKVKFEAIKMNVCGEKRKQNC